MTLWRITLKSSNRSTASSESTFNILRKDVFIAQHAATKRRNQDTLVRLIARIKGLTNNVTW